MFSKTRVGLFFGVIYGLCHLSWVILVAAGWAQPMIDWMLQLHGITFVYAIGEMNYAKAITGVAMAFVGGLIDGFILCALWNWIVGKKK